MTMFPSLGIKAPLTAQNVLANELLSCGVIDDMGQTKAYALWLGEELVMALGKFNLMVVEKK